MNATCTASVSLSRRSVTASAATNTTIGGTECNTTPAAVPAAHDDQVFITYVAASVSHFAARTHTPVWTWYPAVTGPARRSATTTTHTPASSNQAVTPGTEPHTAPAAP